MRIRVASRPFLAAFVVCGRRFPAARTPDAPPQLLNVSTSHPEEAEVGDRLEVIGSGFPRASRRGCFSKGTLSRPGQKPIKGAEIDVEASSTTSDRIG